MDGKNKTSMGLDENIAGLLCYALGWVTGLVFFLLEKDSKYVKFHAFQSIVVFGALTILNVVIGRIPVIGGVVSTLIGLASFVLWIILMVKAYKMEMFKIPVAGDLAEQQANK